MIAEIEKLRPPYHWLFEQTKNGGFRLFGGARVYENSWLSRELAD